MPEGFRAVSDSRASRTAHTGTKMLLVEERGQRLNNRCGWQGPFSPPSCPGPDRGLACYRGLAIRGEITQQRNAALVL
jgi:hypothetical protein